MRETTPKETEGADWFCFFLLKKKEKKVGEPLARWSSTSQKKKKTPLPVPLFCFSVSPRALRKRNKYFLNEWIQVTRRAEKETRARAHARGGVERREFSVLPVLALFLLLLLLSFISSSSFFLPLLSLSRAFSSLFFLLSVSLSLQNHITPA